MHCLYEREHGEGRSLRKGSVSQQANTGLSSLANTQAYHWLSLTQQFILCFKKESEPEGSQYRFKSAQNQQAQRPSLPIRASTNIYSINFGPNPSESELRTLCSLDKADNHHVFILSLDLTPMSVDVEQF